MPQSPTARRQLQQWEADLDPENDGGKRRLERQQRNNKLTLPRLPDGCMSIQGQLDPLSGAKLKAVLDAKVTQLWRRRHAKTNGIDQLNPPPTVLNNDALRAEALLELVVAGANNPNADTRLDTTIIVLIDEKSLRGELTAAGVSTLADGTPIPVRSIRQMACQAGILPMVMGGPSLPLDVGRTRRLATSSQRAALRAVHTSCAISGCDTSFDYCDIHHIQPWANGGPSDLHNLLPLCNKHHTLVHQHGYHLTLDANRVAHLHKVGDGPGHDCADPIPLPPGPPLLPTWHRDRGQPNNLSGPAHNPTPEARVSRLLRKHQVPLRC